jgi:hypothetical protein
MDARKGKGKDNSHLPGMCDETKTEQISRVNSLSRACPNIGT